jgi:hypothetical protein
VKQNGSNFSFITYTNQAVEVPSEFQFLMLDSALEVLNSGSYTLDLRNKFSLDQIAYTKDHIALVLREEVNKKEDKQGFLYSIADGPASQGSLNHTALYDDSNTVSEGIIKWDKRNNAFVFGAIYNVKDSAYAKGFYTWRRNLDDNTLFTAYRNFSPAALNDITGKTAKIQGIYHLRVGDIVIRKDGGIVLSTEQYQESRETVMDMNMYGMSQTNFKYYYYYENLLVLSVNPLGGEDWHSVVHKEQVTVNDNGVFSSYMLSVLPDKLVYVYNDLSRKSWSLNYCEVSEKGVSQNQLLLKPQEYESKLIPQYGEQVAYNEFVIPGMNKRGHVLLKVSF